MASRAARDLPQALLGTAQVSAAKRSPHSSAGALATGSALAASARCSPPIRQRAGGVGSGLPQATIITAVGGARRRRRLPIRTFEQQRLLPASS